MINRRTFLAPLAALPLAAALPAQAHADAPTAPAPGAGRGRPDRLRVVAEKREGRVLDVTVSSPAIGQEAVIRLLLPNGWSKQSHRRWPVLWMMHGATGDHTMWTDHTDLAAVTADRDVLVVVPDGGPCSYYSNWWNYGAYGPPAWQTFHLDEVRTLLERDYGAGPRRAIAGLSMGGLGAMKYAAARPGMFRAAASYSGVLNPSSPRVVVGGRYGDADFAASVAVFIKNYGLDPVAMWGDREEQAAVWAANNPTDLVWWLRGMPLYVSGGDGNPGPLDPPPSSRLRSSREVPPCTQFDPNEAMFGPMSNDFVAAGRKVGLRLTASLGAGTHTMPYWQHHLHESFPMLMDALGA
ncbi:MAG: esterase family protein [Streptomycetaceae bacterium]|nr:esterase family protein [Streptomycetaceae bacterium]